MNLAEAVETPDARVGEQTVRTGQHGQLHGRFWAADGDTRGGVIIVHGLGDHGGRYRELAQSLTAQGWAVFAFDLIGHGRSPGARGRVDRYDRLLADIAHARETMDNLLPGKTQVLLGHSMGGNLALNYLLRRHHFQPVRSDLAGMALCGPMLLPHQKLSAEFGPG